MHTVTQQPPEPIEELTSDADVIAAASKEPRAFAPIFERHFDAIYRYVYQRVGPENADDVTAEVFEIALRKCADYTPTHHSARPWLYGIAAKVAWGHHRSTTSRRRAHLRLASSSDIPETGIATGAQQRVDAAALGNTLRELVKQLPERDQHILHLSLTAEMSAKDIADTIGAPAATVRSRMHRIRKHLRNALTSGEGKTA